MKQLYGCVIGLWLAAAVPALGAPAPLRGLGIDETLDKDPILAQVLDRARLGAADLPVFVRLLVRRGDLGAASTDFTRLDERIDLYARRKIPIVLTLVDVPTDVAGIDAWRSALRSLAEHGRGKVLAYQVGDRLEGAARPAPKDYAYLVKFVAVQVRSIDAAALIVEGSLGAQGAAAWQEQLYREEVAAYVDAVTLSNATDDDRAGADAALAALDGLVTKEDPTAFMGVTGLVLPGEGRGAADRLIGWHLAHLGGRSAFTTCVAGTDALATALRAAMTVKDVFAGEIVTLDEQASTLKLSVSGQDITASIPHRLLYNMTTFATYLVYWAPDRAGERLEVSLHLASAGTTVVRDAAAGTMVRPGDAARDEAAKTSTARVELSDRPMLLDFNFGAQEVYAMRSEAAERAMPTVDEIVARYQQSETAQAALVQNYIANARVDIHFQPTALDSYDVVVENRFFWDPETSEWEETGFSLNGTHFGRNRPPFPLLQPEKVLSLPLTLRFNRDYIYHLEGTDRVGDRLCYVVRFDPIDQARSLYRGKVWIDSERYVRLKVQAVQTNLTAPVVSNEEVQMYEPVGRVNDQPVYLFSKLISHQIMLIAGRNLLVDRNVTFSDFHVNDETFVTARQQARKSDNIMYRDTDKGLRNLIKRGDERVVSDHLTTSAKALAFGATFDPSYDYPVPLVGIDYVNFNFLNRGLQLGFIFSGVLGAGNLQKANIAGTKFDLSVDFFGIAVNSNDQVYDDQGEHKDERLQSRRALTGANLGYQLSDFQKVTLGAHVQYDAFSSSQDNTAPTFVVPVNTTTLNPSVAYEYRRGGYSLLAGYAYFRRADWVNWGYGTDFDPAQRSYTKYSVGLSKDFYFKTFNKIHLNAAYYGGERQDRFSMYRFGLFDETRIRGVPSAGLRFSELGMIRAAYSFNLLNLYRFALYVDHAEGRTPSETTFVPTTGIGTEVNFPGPKMTMLKVGVGKGFLPQMYRGSGSLVVELMVFKPI
jgi:hypothetical protein